jgi:hypothetical protein
MGGAGVVSSRFLRWFGLGGKSFLWWVFGGSRIFSPIPSPTLFSPSPSPSDSCMSRSLSSTEAHDQTTNPSTSSTHHSHPTNDQHNVHVPDSSKHAIHM